MGPRKGETGWKPLAHHVVLRILHNPPLCRRYRARLAANAAAHGRDRTAGPPRSSSYTSGG